MNAPQPEPELDPSPKSGTPGPAPRGVVLPEGYYHVHFLELVRTVQGRYDDLLSESEKAFLHTFHALTDAAQKLYVRLVNRVGPWFVVSKLRYAEIGDCGRAARELVDAGFLDTHAHGAPCTPLEALATLTAADLKRAFPAACKDAGPKATRGDILEAITRTCAPSDTVARAVALSGGIVRPRHTSTVRLLTFLYFGNATQGPTDFVLSDMGLMRYEAYALDASTRGFEARASLERAFAAQELFDALVRDLEIHREPWTEEQLVQARNGALALWDEVHRASREGPDVRASKRTLRRLSKALNLVGNRLERLGCVSEALACYQEEGVPPARERRTRLLDKAKRVDEAERLALDTLRTSFDEGELAFAFRYLVKKRGHALDALPVPPEERPLLEAFLATKHTVDVWPQRHLALPPRLRALGVEEAALFALAEEGFEGVHGENLPWCALFGLVFWEATYAAVPGAFHHAYQLGPNDGFSPAFRAAREVQCEAILRAFVSGELTIDTLEARWNAKHGLSNRWIVWPALTWDTLATLLARCPRAALGKVFERMLRHPGRFASGFPDLMLVREGAVEFWEVKGPGDELRPHQKSWLAALQSAGFRVGVLVVSFDAPERTTPLT